MGYLYIAGEHINAGSTVVCGKDDKAYDAAHGGPVIGIAEEQLREGFRIYVSDDGSIREDDA